jgi:ATP-dependent Clp protease ATP-binding subunit ClpC
LTKEDVCKIAKIHLDKLAKKLQNVNVTLTYSNSAIDYIAQKGYDREYGIRPLKRIIQTEIEDKISEQIISAEIKQVFADVNNSDQLVCNFQG